MAAATPSTEPLGTEGGPAPSLGQHHPCRGPAAVVVGGWGAEELCNQLQLEMSDHLDDEEKIPLPH